MEITTPSQIRRLDVNQDLLQVADLIDKAFQDQMDQEGQEYLQQIRKAARNKDYSRWIPGSHERVSYPLFGYVWVQDGRIIGNLSLFPYLHQFKWRYLIANVAVDPGFRGMGIGKELTRVGIQHAFDHGAQSVWLQVREENTVALRLYRSLGFVERVRRSTWHYLSNPKNTPPQEFDSQIKPRSDRDWSLHSRWLDIAYPPEVTWYFQFSKNRFSPGLIQKINAIFSPGEIQHISAEIGKELIGVATVEYRTTSHSVLWMAPKPEDEERALSMLLKDIANRIHIKRKISMNYPAGHFDGTFEESGFSKQNTLIWMEKRFI